MGSPSTGVKSTLKSPVCTTVPTGVWMASAQAPAMEWFTLMNSMRNAPSCMRSPGSTTFICTPSMWRCSLSFCATSAKVSRVPYMGAGSSLST